MKCIVEIAERYAELCRQKTDDYKLLLIISRFFIREFICKLNLLDSEFGYFSRQNNLLKHQGISAPFLDAKVMQLQTKREVIRKNISELGGASIAYMDAWQESGATFDDLCNLCGRPRRIIEKELYGENPKEKQLSELMTSGGLDYYSNGSGFYEFTQDGPFSHATREFLIDQMINTEEGVRAAQEALVRVFPQIWELRLTQATDYDGNQALVDKDGEIVGYPPEDVL